MTIFFALCAPLVRHQELPDSLVPCGSLISPPGMPYRLHAKNRVCLERALRSSVLIHVPAPGDAEQCDDAWTIVSLDGVRVVKIVLEKKRVPQRDARASSRHTGQNPSLPAWLWPQLLHSSLDGERACRAQIPAGYPCRLALERVRLAAQVSLSPLLASCKKDAVT